MVPGLPSIEKVTGELCAQSAHVETLTSALKNAAVFGGMVFKEVIEIR